MYDIPNSANETLKLSIVGSEDGGYFENLDIVITTDLRNYYGTPITQKGVNRLFEKNKRTGECGSGKYFWCSDMIIVADLTVETLKEVVLDLFEKDDLGCVFLTRDNFPPTRTDPAGT